jgi:hypothetical protein
MHRGLQAVMALSALVVVSGVTADDLSAAEPGAPGAARQDGWRELFNGKDLTGWQNATGGPPGAGWVVQERAMVRQDKAGDIWTKDRFGNFILEIEFKTEGNSGIFIRTDHPRDCVQTGIEIQIENPAKTPSKHSCGAVYDALAPSKEMTKKGEWNRAVITARDNKLTVVISGERIIDMDLDRWSEPGKNPDGTRNKFKAALKDFKREGHIGLQDHGSVVGYRNIRIRPVCGQYLWRER